MCLGIWLCSTFAVGVSVRGFWFLVFFFFLLILALSCCSQSMHPVVFLAVVHYCYTEILLVVW